MATFGNTTTQTTYDNNIDDYKNGSRYTLSEGASISKLTAYLDNTGGAACHVKGLIYAESGSNTPSALLGTTGEVSIGAGASVAWVDMTFSSPIVLVAGSYWLFVHLAADGDDTFAFRCDKTTGVGGYGADTYSDGPANPFGSYSSQAWNYCIYATYEPVSVFGKTDLDGLSSTTVTSNQVRSTVFTLTEAGTVTSLSAYMSGGASNTQVHKFAIWDDDGAGGIPGTLLGLTAEQTIAIDQAEGWVTADLVTPVALAAGDYWLGHHSGSTFSACNVWRSVSGSNNAYYATDSYADGTESTCPAGTLYGRIWAVYATYTTPPVVTSGLVAEYIGKLAKNGTLPGNNSDPTSTWDDLMGSSDATLSGFGWTTSTGWAGSGTAGDPYGVVFNVDGVNDFVHAPYAAFNFGSSSFSVEAWFIASDKTVTHKFMITKGSSSGYQGFRFGYAITTGIPWVLMGGLSNYDEGSIGGTTDVADGVLHHMVFDYVRGGDAVCYVDGAQVGTCDISGATGSMDATSELYVPGSGGASSGSGVKIFTMRFYSTPLGSAGAAQNYAAGVLAASTDAEAATDCTSLIQFGIC